MKARLVSLSLLFFCSLGSNALACSVCYGSHPTETLQHMGVAVWFMIGALMSVLGGFGAFGFHLWRLSRMPLAPDQELAEEDFEKYE